MLKHLHYVKRRYGKSRNGVLRNEGAYLTSMIITERIQADFACVGLTI